MKNTAFCSSTLSALQQITSIFDFIWPTYTALWNLRWQVKGYTSIIESEGEKVTPDDLRRIFVTKKIHGENLKRLCENNWSVQENLFAQILLAYAFSIYEGWIAEIGDLLKWKKEQKDSLQFQQNLAEESIFTDIAEMVKKRRKEIDFSCLLILNKTDLIYSKRHAPGLLASICKEYEAKISALGFMHTYVVAFSYVATKILSRLSQNIIDQDDCDDAIYFLNKIGRRLSEGITPVQMRTYLLQHKRALCLFSGEGPVEKTLTHWRKDC